MPKYVLPIAERFWSKVDKSGECWLWTGSRFNGRYGQFSVGSRKDHTKTQALAHRVAWLLTHGPIPKGRYVCHNCPGGDNILCVRPEHLYLGTAKDNTQDAVKKGQLATGGRHWSRTRPEQWAKQLPRFLAARVTYRGEQHGRAKLTDIKVLEIRALYAVRGVSYKQLADKYGVTPAMIRFIIQRKNWAHI